MNDYDTRPPVEAGLELLSGFASARLAELGGRGLFTTGPSEPEEDGE